MRWAWTDWLAEKKSDRASKRSGTAGGTWEV
jgi:hypothetical protein